ncbi:MAG: zinc carboxypeptidase [Flavobacteriaceae bacterium]|nr:zinc carboxypeptidase [Flavobacteriaceae bacterium]
MRKIFYIIFLISFSLNSQDNFDLNYYFKNKLDSFNPNIPKPSDFLLKQKEVGSSHVSHDRLVQYMYALANSSKRIRLKKTGETYEGRPLLTLIITSEKNHSNLDIIRENHLKYLSSTNNKDSDFYNRPVVIYQGYSIHGNEPSGSNAALLYAYYLAASNEKELLEQLDQSVILMDPSMNPDGLQRFANWVNSNKSEYLNPDKNDREFNEHWPKGRTNHYWFDMNRDWLPVQLPESKARINTFHNWYPNVLTDHHEMGTNSTFFFQPGISSRVNPLTPYKNQELTQKIGRYHEAILIENGSLFYSEEDYDDFYYGKGSTFPDINGGIGILFEQGSSRGHFQESINGNISFQFTIKNQLLTSLSTLKASIDLKKELFDYQHSFFNEFKNKKNEYIIVSDKYDISKLYHFYEILKNHKIETKKLNNNKIINGTEYKTENSFLIPTNQKNYRLLNAMIENRNKFNDSLFYDISAWSFLHSFNLDYERINISEKLQNLDFSKPTGSIINESEYAYVFSLNDYYTPKALYKLLNNGINIKVATEEFSIKENKFSYGSILIYLKNQSKSHSEITDIIKDISYETGINFYGFNTSHANGIDLGSNSFKKVRKPEIGLIVGDGVTSYDAGEIWHLLDTRYEIPITKIKYSDLSIIDLHKYNTLILVNGSYSSDNNYTALKKWVEEGGNLIGFRNSINFLQNNKLINLSFNENKPKPKNLNFNQKKNFYGSQLTSGAIFNVELDLTHPINYGYYKKNLSIFRNTNIYIKNDSIDFNNPIKYSNYNTLISGYISKENKKSILNSRPFVSLKIKKGRINLFTDNTNFRAFWYGTNKLMMNSIFFFDLM